MNVMCVQGRYGGKDKFVMVQREEGRTGKGWHFLLFLFFSQFH